MIDNLRFYISKRRMFVLILVTAFFVYNSVSLIESKSVLVNTIGVLNLLLFLPCLFIGLYSLLTTKPHLELSALGIKHKTVTKVPISWNEIASAELKKNILVINLNKTISPKRFRFIYRKTATTSLKENTVKLNVSPLSIDYNRLNNYLQLKLSSSN